MKIKFCICLILYLFCQGCSNQDDAKRALNNAGYTNIKTTGHEFFSCGEDDFYSTGFKATNHLGKEISGVVCSGLFKGATIRF